MTSVEVNEAEFIPQGLSLSSTLQESKRLIRFIDFPGHSRLRNGLEDQVEDAVGIVFMVDSADMDIVDGKIADTAEFLYDVFIAAVKKGVEPRMLICCNKCDKKDECKSVEEIKDLLTDQLTIIKNSRHSVEVEGEEERQISLGRECRDFDFDFDSGLDVDFCEISVKEKELEGLDSFLSELFL